jgi:hypothetical protein
MCDKCQITFQEVLRQTKRKVTLDDCEQLAHAGKTVVYLGLGRSDETGDFVILAGRLTKEEERPGGVAVQVAVRELRSFPGTVDGCLEAAVIFSCLLDTGPGIVVQAMHEAKASQN